MTRRMEEIAGLVLIGGRSERMGRDKALLELGGRPLWQIAANTLSPLVGCVLLVGNVNVPGTGSATRRIDDDPPGLGPLGGIVTGLEKSGCAHHLVLAVDYPMVTLEFLRLLLDSADGFQAVCGQSATHLEPLVAYYHADCAPVARTMIDSGEIRTHKLFERVRSRIITGPEYGAVDPQRRSLINVNTPDDLKRVSVLMADE
ncbi:MAG TPA: molybdenum cofactor guanylyltransferase [candidate division Zixibacteria bacterium]